LVTYHGEAHPPPLERQRLKKKRPPRCERGDMIRKACMDVDSVKKILNSQNLIETSFNIVRSHVTNIHKRIAMQQQLLDQSIKHSPEV